VVVSAQAERAIFAANELRRLTPAPFRSWRPWRRVQLNYDRLLLELSLPRATGASEDYLLVQAAFRLKPDLLEPVAPDPSDPTTKKLQRAAKSWPKLMELWKVDLDVDLEALPTWPAFADWRQLRHVLVHRLGSWQPGLDPQPTLALRISRLGQAPDLYRGPIPLAADDLPRAIADAIRFVLEVDAR
jgi:hypothetical protein